MLAGVVLLCCAVLALGWWSKARCLGDDAWAGGEQYTQWCYSDVYALWFARGLDEGASLYGDHPGREHPVEYPVLTGAQMWAAGQVARLAPPTWRAAAFFHVTAALGAVAGLVTLALLARAGLPPRRLLWWAGAPTLALAAFLNWDPVPVALLTAGVVAHLRGRDGLAGAMAGLGAAAKLFPGLLVPLVAATRLAQGRRRDAAVHAGAAAAAWLAVNLPVALTAPDGWRRFLEINRARPADWDSLWFLAERVRGAAIAVPTLNLASAGLFVAGAAVIAVAGARRRQPERWWELALPLLAWFLLTNKVYSPQFSLWLLPLFALAFPGWGWLAAFALADVAVTVTRFPYLAQFVGDGLPGAWEYGPFGFAVLVRAVVLAAAASIGWRETAGRP